MTSPLDILKALSDETRLRIAILLQRGFLNVQELTTILGPAQSTISHHLKLLQSAGVVRNMKQGTWNYYTLADERESPLAHRLVALTAEYLPTMNGSYTLFLEDAQNSEKVIASRRRETGQYFDAVAKKWGEIRHHTHGVDSYLREIVRDIPQGCTFADLGCGAGALLAEILPRRGTTIGVDYSPAMLEEARRFLGAKSAAVELRLGAIEHLPLADRSIDYAVAHMVFHYLHDPKAALQDIARVLREGATLLIVDLVQHEDETLRDGYAHVWLGFEPQDFKSWLSTAGFLVQEIKLLGAKEEVFCITARTVSAEERTTP